MRHGAIAVLTVAAVVVGCSTPARPTDGNETNAPSPAEDNSSAPAVSEATPTPTEGPTIVEDFFSDAFSGWDVVEPGRGIAAEVMGYRDDSYFMRAEPPNLGFASFAPIEGDPPEGDIAVQADVRFTSGRGSAGLVCRGGTDRTAGYLASIDTRGAYALLRLGGTAPRPLTEPGAEDAALGDTAEWNRVRLECIGVEDDTTLRLYLNDQLVAEIVDPDPLAVTGEVGLFIAPAGRGRSVEATFDNFLAERQAAST